MVESLIEHRSRVLSSFLKLWADIVGSVTDVHYGEPKSVIHVFNRIAAHVLTKTVDRDLSVGRREYLLVHREEASE